MLQDSVLIYKYQKEKNSLETGVGTQLYKYHVERHFVKR